MFPPPLFVTHTHTHRRAEPSAGLVQSSVRGGSLVLVVGETGFLQA